MFSHRTKVLDHGYVKLVGSWGSDERIIEAARMSTNKGFNGWGTPEEPGDEKLLKFLYDNNHASPFEMAGMVLEVQAPIFVFREWHRHRTQSYNEMSARYTPLPDVNYVPSISRIVEGGSSVTKNKQAQSQGKASITEDQARDFRDALTEEYDRCERLYQDALERGVPKELARVILPVGRYSRMRASANLRNWIAFCTLRSAENAQWEISEYSKNVELIMRDLFPRTYDLFRPAT